MAAASPYSPGVGGQAEQMVGLDRVGAVVLQHVGAQLVDQTDTTTFVAGGVDHHATSFGGDAPQAVAELDAAVAAQGTERVARQALGVQPHQHAGTVPHVTGDEGHVHEAGGLLEGMRGERAVGGRQRDVNSFDQLHARPPCTRCT